MNALEGLRRLRESGLRAFTTSDFRNLTRLPASAATQALRRMAAARHVCSLKRGVWALTGAGGPRPEEAVGLLADPFPAYVSLESALHAHGVVPQIPAAIHVVTAGRAARYRTPLGEFRFHHLDGRLFGSPEDHPPIRDGVALATAEKAILDTLHLRYRLGGRPYVGDWDLSRLDVVRLRRSAARFSPAVHAKLADLLDATDLRAAKREAKGFTNWADIRKNLERIGAS